MFHAGIAMDTNKFYAVITGDIVDSSKVKAKDTLIQNLKAAFEDIRSRCSNAQSLPSFDIFRGDSFQCVLPDSRKALWAGLIIRSCLQKNQPEDHEADWDARLSIGLGTIDYLPENISEGDGPAYRNSGPVLDELKGDYRTAVTTPWENMNSEFKASCALLDAVINKWTQPQAEIVHMLLLNKTPKMIGRELGISQAAVHYRVKGAGWFAVEVLLERYEKVMDFNLKESQAENDNA